MDGEQLIGAAALVIVTIACCIGIYSCNMTERQTKCFTQTKNEKCWDNLRLEKHSE